MGQHLTEMVGCCTQFLRPPSDKRSIWVKEAEARMREERYHPMFGGLIELMELNFG